MGRRNRLPQRHLTIEIVNHGHAGASLIFNRHQRLEAARRLDHLQVVYLIGTDRLYPAHILLISVIDDALEHHVVQSLALLTSNCASVRPRHKVAVVPPQVNMAKRLHELLLELALFLSLKFVLEHLLLEFLDGDQFFVNGFVVAAVSDFLELNVETQSSLEAALVFGLLDL